MVKYRNQREIEELNAEDDDILVNDPVMVDEPKSVEDAIFKKRYADSRRGHQEYAREKEAEIADLKKQLEHTYKSVVKAPTSEAEILEWRKNYPEFAGILDVIIDRGVESRLRESKLKVDKIEERQRDLDVKEAVLALKRIHPDFDQLVNDENFHNWLEKQSKKYQEAIYNDLDVDAASFVIDKYKLQKSDKSKKVDDKRSVEDAAKVVRSSSVTSDIVNDFGDYDFTESQIERESRKNRNWFEENEDKIMKAMREGRVHMDISGAAQ